GFGGGGHLAAWPRVALRLHGPVWHLVAGPAVHGPAAAAEDRDAAARNAATGGRERCGLGVLDLARCRAETFRAARNAISLFPRSESMAAKPIPEGYQNVIPYLIVRG